MATPESAANAIAGQTERLSADFARELAAIMRTADRRLRPILAEAIAGNRTATVEAARGIALRRSVREALREAGYDDFASRVSTEAVESVASEVMRSRLAKGAAKLVAPSAQRIRALAVLTETNILDTADDITTALMRAVAQFSFTVTPIDDVLKQLEQVITDETMQVQTLFDTQVSMVARQVEAMATEDLGADQAFLYTGPIDGRTRDWCLERVGKVFTRSDIDDMDNAQLPNPFITGGGYNCRHMFIAVAGDELVALAGMNLRVDGYEAQVTEARQLRKQARRSDRARRARSN